MANIPLTERLLADAGGWQVLKHARALWETGRVSGPVYKPPLLLGLVREGDRDYRAGLRIESPTHVENLCACRLSRESGTICAHSVAVGLALIRPGVSPPKPADAARPSPPQSNVALVADETADHLLHIVLPPNFADSWKRGSVTVGFEIEQNGAKKAPIKKRIIKCNTLETRRHRYDSLAIKNAGLVFRNGDVGRGSIWPTYSPPFWITPERRSVARSA